MKTVKDEIDNIADVRMYSRPGMPIFFNSKKKQKINYFSKKFKQSFLIKRILVKKVALY